MQQTDSIQTVESAQAVELTHSPARPKISLSRRRRDSGAMLLAVLFMMAMMVIVAMAIAPSFVQQMRRDREEEMIHRGTEYARAIKKFYKKFGRYPANLEQLDNTNQIRFLRKRFKDPLTKDGEWKLLHYGDIATLTGGAAMGTSAAVQGTQGGVQGLGSSLTQSQQSQATSTGDQSAGTAALAAQLSPQPQSGFMGNPSQGGVQPGGAASPFAGGAGGGGAQGQSGFSLGPGLGQNTNSSGGQSPGAPGQAGNNNTIFGNTGVGGQTFGGGAIVGVASKDKDKTIRIYNKKKTYDEWVFIYSPTMDRINVLLRGPYNGQSFGGTQVGTPAGQLNQGNQGAFGQQSGAAPTQQPGGVGQQGPQQQSPQQNQQLTPGGQFPPDQTQPQQ